MDMAVAPSSAPSHQAWSPSEFEARLRDKGQAYHIHHPFNVRMNAGGCTPQELRCWVANRFYYQICIPRKDAAILANMPDRAQRRLWVERILDHDGHGDYEGSSAGGIEAWTRLGEALGIDREELWSLRHVAPAVRFEYASGSYLSAQYSITFPSIFFNPYGFANTEPGSCVRFPLSLV